MWSYHPDLLARPVPRYTSYPTAAEFTEQVGAPEQAAGLAGIGDDEPISLYLHIPYCREICWYCGCNTGRANRSQRLVSYLDALGSEIDLVAARLEGRGRVVRVALGGGSPNAIAPEQLTSLARRLTDSFAIRSATWSVEIDPRGFDLAMAEALARIGVERASLGAQTFDPAIQAAIGRIQPTGLIEQASVLLRAAGVTSLNFDLMYGLPGQDEASLLASIEEAERIGADRLAVFGYAHVPHLVPRQKRIDTGALPDAGERFAMAAAAHDQLAGSGWLPVGFDHYARPRDPLADAARTGRVRRNFQGFTDDPCDTLIGIGASAISRFKDALVQNEKTSGRYNILVGNALLAGTRGVATPPSERVHGRAIEQLLCRGTADLAELPDIAAIRAASTPFVEAGVVRWNGNRLDLSNDSQPYARSVAALLDPWRAESGTRFSSAV